MLLLDSVRQRLLLVLFQIGNIGGGVDRQLFFLHHLLQFRLQLGQAGDLLDIGAALAGLLGQLLVRPHGLLAADDLRLGTPSGLTLHGLA